MKQESVLLRVFSRKPLDMAGGRAALAFLMEWGGGAFAPVECGVYEAFDSFSPELLERYSGWMVSPGGSFAFRRPWSPISIEGMISNLLIPEIMEAEEGGPPRVLPAARQPEFCTRWSIRIVPSPAAHKEAELLKTALLAACRTAAADYGFVADAASYRARHFQSLRQGKSVVQQYVGDDPTSQLPGLYWFNYLGPTLAKRFAKERLAALGGLCSIEFAEDAPVCLRFGELPRDSRFRREMNRQRKVIQLLGESSFFDPHRQAVTQKVP
jgi:hypothetical protein